MKRNSLFHIVEILIKILVYTLDTLILKDNKSIIFSNNRFSDNCRYLFEYMIDNNNNKYKVYWVSRDKKEVAYLKEKYGDSYILYIYTFKTFWIFLRSKIVIISHGLGIFYPLTLNANKKIVINLWHGFCIKKIGLWLDINNKTKKEFEKFRYIVANSDIERYVFATVFGKNPNNIWLTGSPRVDKLVCNYSNNKSKLKRELVDKKTILYAPTYRDGDTNTELLPFKDRNIHTLNEFLKKNDSLLLFRIHVNEMSKLNFDSDLHTEMRVYDFINYPDVNDILKHVDILITDYSSIFIDYLLFNRPIIFIPYDYKQFDKMRGFTIDYNRFTPGPKVATQNKLQFHIQNYLNDSHIDSKRRGEISKLFHYHTDGNSSKRIFDKIKML